MISKIHRDTAARSSQWGPGASLQMRRPMLETIGIALQRGLLLAKHLKHLEAVSNTLTTQRRWLSDL